MARRERRTTHMTLATNGTRMAHKTRMAHIAHDAQQHRTVAQSPGKEAGLCVP